MSEKLFPFWWLVPPPVIELEEGNYSSYAIKASFDDADASDGYLRQDAVFNTAETYILIIDIWNTTIKTYNIAAGSLGAAIAIDVAPLDGDGGYSIYMKKSAYGRYVTLMGYTTYFYDPNRIRIFKDGVQIQTLTCADLGLNSNTIRNVSISPTGKYIIVSGVRTASGNMGWVLLEGS